MKAVIQRVGRAEVRVDGAGVSRIGQGLLILLGVEQGDGDIELRAMQGKIQGLRIFEDDGGRMNLSCEDIGGAYLVVSQFTLCGDLSRGKRPGFEQAMKPPESERIYETFCERLTAATGLRVERGRFGASMEVELVNAGPATFILHYPPGG